MPRASHAGDDEAPQRTQVIAIHVDEHPAGRAAEKTCDTQRSAEIEHVESVIHWSRDMKRGTVASRS